MTTRQLSTIRPDLEDLVLQLQQKASTKNAWKSLLPTDAGQTILELVAAVGALDQFSLEMLFREAFPQTSRVDSNSLAIARMLGVRLKRKTPASVEVTFTNNTNIPISFPQFSIFDLEGNPVFNRDQLSVPANATVEATLYEGTLKLFTFISQGRDFQSFTTPEKDFVVSDVDVQVKINSVVIPRTVQGLHKFKKRVDNSDPLSPIFLDNPVFQDFTTRNGALQIIFGNDFFGVKPKANDLVEVIYMETKGLLGNDGSLSGSELTFEGQLDDFIVVANTGLKNGSNELEPRLYKTIAPRLFAAQDVASQKQDFDILFNNPVFPIVDYRIQGQREIDTTDVRFMNTAKVWLLLPNDLNNDSVVPTQQDFRELTKWLTKSSIFTLHYFYDQDFSSVFGLARPASLPYFIEADVYCFNTADLEKVKTEVVNALKELTRLKLGAISRDIYRSDIIELIKKVSPEIDYIILKNPTTDIITNTSTLELTTVVQDDVGTLPPALYEYVVSVVFDYDPTLLNRESLPSIPISINTNALNSSILLKWEPMFGAASYNVYGRTGGNFGLIASVTSPQFLDDGSLAPSAQVPSQQDFSGFRFPDLAPKPNTLTPNDGILIKTLFSDR